MAAQGQSTPEIAQALFITPKTVETHLAHTYQKLDIHTRAELARALPQITTRTHDSVRWLPEPPVPHSHKIIARTRSHQSTLPP
jgi:hypothetical protein